MKEENAKKKDRIDSLLKKLKTSNFYNKNKIIKSLGKNNYINNPIILGKLYEILESANWNERHRISSLNSLGKHGKNSKLFELLLKIINGKHQPKELRRACVTHLSRHKNPKAIDTFKFALNDDYRFIRFWAVRGLIKIENLDSDKALIFALGDKDQEIRKEARIHLEGLGNIMVPAFTKAFNNPNSSKFLKYGVIGLLGRSKNPEALNVLLKAINDDNDRVVTIAIRGLGKFKDTKIIPPLIELYKTNEKKRRLIVDALFRIGRDKQKILIEKLYPFLLDDNKDIYKLAFSLIEKMPNSYIILGDLIEKGEISKDLKNKIKVVMKKI